MWERGAEKLFENGSFLERLAQGIAKWTAMAGGIILFAMILVVLMSIVGRSFTWVGLKPILGDYELTAAGTGLAGFAFMPWAHLTRSHAFVSIATDRLGRRINAWIITATDCLMLALAGFIAWRLYDGMLDKFHYHETTLLLGLPTGWAYAASLVGAVALVLVALFMFCQSLARALGGTQTPPSPAGDAK